MRTPLLVIIIDGFGIAKEENNSAITKKTAPHLNKFFEEYPTVQLSAAGESVGLPYGQMGNSEVGHINIGAGRIVYQDLTRINNNIKTGDFYKNKVLKNAMIFAKKNGSALHLMGLLSDGGVHSHVEHLFALLKMAKKLKVTNVYIHAFLDGRDTSPTSGKVFLQECQNVMKKLNIGKIATIIGRYYAMDRDNRWDRIKVAYDAIVNRYGLVERDFLEAIENSYKNGITDEFIEPIICDQDVKIKKDDSIIFFNFRPDRARQLTRAFVDENFNGFERYSFFKDLNFTSMTQYDKDISGVNVAFEAEKLKNTLAEVISQNKLTQLRIAETEKYAHVTYFLNGGIDKKYIGEDRILVPSPKVATYDLQPEMSAFEITKIVKGKIHARSYDLIVLNYANCDMVGHTGNFEAAKIAVKTVDNCVNELVNEILKVEGCVIITADHGNAEKMLDKNRKIFTAHTSNPVPFCIIGYNCNLKTNGKLADIAPTILKILNLKKPKEMTGQSLII